MSEKFFECVVDLKEQTGFIDGQTSACLYSKPKPETGSNVDKEKVKKKKKPDWCGSGYESKNLQLQQLLSKTTQKSVDKGVKASKMHSV